MTFLTMEDFTLTVSTVNASDWWPAGLVVWGTTKPEVPVVSRGFCDEQLHLLTSQGCYIYYDQYVPFMYVYPFSSILMQVLKDT
jgi:hypothetical protein